nr:MAG TPA: hypothetical protein [Caudoviricetes sp.]
MNHNINLVFFLADRTCSNTLFSQLSISISLV